MRTNKKTMFLYIVVIVAGVIVGIIWNVISSKPDNTNNALIESQNVLEVSTDEAVTDECTEEWVEYNQELQSAFKEASSLISEETSHYLLKSKDGYICVYCISENNEQLLYKETSISVDYLSPEDIENLKTGIEIVGNDELNKILEDFE